MGLFEFVDWDAPERYTLRPNDPDRCDSFTAHLTDGRVLSLYGDIEAARREVLEERCPLALAEPDGIAMIEADDVERFEA